MKKESRRGGRGKELNEERVEKGEGRREGKGEMERNQMKKESRRGEGRGGGVEEGSKKSNK